VILTEFPRHWIGKLVGGVIGFLKGGPWGALLGGYIGHIFDQWFSGGRNAKHAQQVFFDSLFATLGHLAKSDGRVSEAEVAMADNLMQNMALSVEERNRAIHQFTRGKQADFVLYTELQTFARISMLRPDLRRMFIDILLAAATADGGLTQPEYAVIQQVGSVLRIPRQLLEQLIASHQPGAGYSQPGRPQTGPDPYAVLGIAKDASAAQIKRAYRKLISQHHPDKLVARGLPKEMMELARKKASEINLAYDQIKEQRGFN
jgi:DnaJ like chaperone protein